MEFVVDADKMEVVVNAEDGGCPLVLAQQRPGRPQATPAACLPHGRRPPIAATPACCATARAGLVKRYRFDCLDCENVQPTVDKEAFPTLVVAEAAELDK